MNDHRDVNTVTNYLRGCKCDHCRALNTRGQKRRRLLARRGVRLSVPLTEVRPHVLACLEAFVDLPRHRMYAQLAERADVGRSTVTRIAEGRDGRVLRRVADSLLAIDPEGLRPHQRYVPHNGTRQRVYALMRLGYPQDWVAAEISLSGRAHMNLQKQFKRGNDRAYAQRLVDLCREIGDTPGPSNRTRRWAERRGYEPPAFYDVDDFYDVEWDGSVSELTAERRDDALLEDVELIEKSLREPSNDEERAWNRALVEERVGVKYQYIVTLRRRRASREWKERRDSAA